MGNLEAAPPTVRAPDKAGSDTSILRTGPEAVALRRRTERGARISRYIFALLGVVTASAGLALWISTASALGLALGAFGGVLVILAVTQHLLLRRDQVYWPDEALLWEDGLELVLHNGEVRGATWSDADLVLQLVARKAPPPANQEFLLLWATDSKIPAIELSAEGFDRLMHVAGRERLTINERRQGRRSSMTRWIEIRQGITLAPEHPEGPSKATTPP